MPLAKDWVRLKLDLDQFVPALFVPYVEACRASGIRLCTMAELGDTAGRRRELYELNKQCAADIPERGEFYTYEEYLTERIETPTYHPHGVVIAQDGEVWVGLAAVSVRPSEGYAFSEMTGVLRSHRGRGLALALKVRSIDFARSTGVRWLRTVHHPENASAIALNRRLGFVADIGQSANPRTSKTSTVR